MPKTKKQIATSKGSPEGKQTVAHVQSEPKYVKIIVFDDQNRVLTTKNKTRFVLPGGRVEWDDDYVETAARREVFEAANIALGLVLPVTVIKTRNHESQNTETAVFVARSSGDGQANSIRKPAYRFLRKDDFLEINHRNELVCALVDAAWKILTAEEIKEEHDQTTLRGREKYNSQSLY